MKTGIRIPLIRNDLMNSTQWMRIRVKFAIIKFHEKGKKRRFCTHYAESVKKCKVEIEIPGDDTE